MRIALLCNDRIALPAMEQLMQAGLLAAVGMPAKANPLNDVVRLRCAQGNIAFQFFSKKDLVREMTEWLGQHQPEVVFVKTFPYRIPHELLDIPRHGFINFHYAPLPHWRGPNPLFWMIRNGVDTGGVTIHRMTKDFDEGPVLLQQGSKIAPASTLGSLCSQLAFAGANLTGVLINGMQSGSLQAKPQSAENAGWYKHPRPEDLFIKWSTMTAAEIDALVRACNPFNKGAATRWRGWAFGITHAEIAHGSPEAKPGTVLALDEQNGFRIACLKGEAIHANVVYCEEGFYPGKHMSHFGLYPGQELT